MSRVRIRVMGNAGSGKSAIMQLIFDHLRSRGIEVDVDPKDLNPNVEKVLESLKTRGLYVVLSERRHTRGGVKHRAQA